MGRGAGRGARPRGVEPRDGRNRSRGAPADDEVAAPDPDDPLMRMEAMLGDAGLDMDQALDVLLEHVRANLQMPCEVTGSEDFKWEEPYVLGGWDPKEYRRLKK